MGVEQERKRESPRVCVLVMGIVPKIEERNEPVNLEKNGTRNAGSR